MDFRGRDVVSINDFTLEEINYILDVAEGMVPAAKGEEVLDLIPGKILAMMFYEPSTRTMLSFETAMKRIGGKVIGFSDVRATSTAKGETLADTIKMVEAYADVIDVKDAPDRWKYGQYGYRYASDNDNDNGWLRRAAALQLLR